MNALGQAYQQGKGTEADLAKAAEWYRKAADLKLAEPRTISACSISRARA